MLLTLATFLVEKGCNWEATNSAGAKASNILSSKGYPQVEIDGLQAQYDTKMGRFPYGGAGGCVGQKGECLQPPAFQLTCPHKPTYKSCSKCILKNVFDNLKDDCEEETVGPIPHQADAPPSSPMKDSKLNILIDDDILFINEVKKEPGVSPSLNWIYDGTLNGCIYDGFGCRYDWNGSQKNGVMVYRCEKQLAGFKLGSCTAVVYRTINSKGGTLNMWPEYPKHNHPVTKRTMDHRAGTSGKKLSIVISW